MHLWSARSLSQLAAGELRTGKPQTLAVFTSGSGQDESTTSTKGQLLPYQSATGRTTMCSVWRHVSTHAAVTESQPVASNKQDPRVPLAPWNWPELLLSICSVNHAQKIPPIWLFPLIQPPFFIPTHPGYTLSPHLPLARSLSAGSFYSSETKQNVVCVHFLCGFPFSPAPLWLQQAETCVWGLRKYCAYTGGQCRGLNETQLWEIWIRATVFTGMRRLSVISGAGWAEADWRRRTNNSRPLRRSLPI